jgi:tetratricopeptide (TPR) repeat protein/predicted Ser/Thr protein kinase
MPAEEAEPTPHSGLTPEKDPEETLDSGPVGAYQLLRPLGHGGMGVVYLARDRRLKRTVALKMIRVDSRAHPERLARFRREAELLARLRHGNVVQIYEAGEHAGSPFLAMEYVEGGTLAQKLSAGPLPIRTVVELVESLARGMHAAHECGVIHRDLKPANVMLATDGTPKITDFGLAKPLAANPSTAWATETQSGAILGTPAYMAPEQVSASHKVGPVADVYALGIILYECLTGRPPFQAGSPLETLEQVRTQEPVSPRRLRPGLPRDVDVICLKCLEKEPVRRYPSAEALADDLGRFLRSEPIRARPVSWLTRLVKWGRRNLSLAALLVVSALSLVTFIAGALVYQAWLRDALTQAKAKEAEAQGERRRADANYREARDALQRMLERARNRSGAGIPRLEELRREQQEDALAFYLKMAEQQGDDPEVRFEAARAHHQAALLQDTLGRPKEADRNAARAEEMLAALVAEFPGDRPYRSHHAEALKLRGWVGQLPPAEGEDCLRRALARAEELVREEPTSVAYRSQKADIHGTLGSFLSHQKRIAEAEDHYRQAVALDEVIVGEEPGEPRHRLALAQAYLNLSVTLQATQRSGKELHDKAEATLEQLHREKPDDEGILESLAVLRINWAYTLAGEGKPEDAVADLNKNVAMLNEALRREPNHAVLRERLYRTHGVRGQMFETQKRFAEAAEEVRRVVELSPTPAQADFHRLFLAMTYARAGKHELAMKEIEDWGTRVTWTTRDNQLLYAAQVCGTAIEALQRDESLSASKRAEQTSRCTARGLDFLRKARRAAGTVAWKKAAPDLRKDEQLRPLWDDPEFKQMTDVK